jgi:hypothetical protein
VVDSSDRNPLPLLQLLLAHLEPQVPQRRHRVCLVDSGRQRPGARLSPVRLVPLVQRRHLVCLVGQDPRPLLAHLQQVCDI